MIPEQFVFLGAAFNIAGAVSYLIDTLKGKAQPNRVSWFLWAVAPLIAFSAQISKGVGYASLMTFLVGFNPAVIFLASFLNRKSVWKLGPFDYLCGIFSVAALVLWKITGEGNVAIFLGIVADFFASVPTIVKSYKHPETENYKVYLCGIISAAITLLVLKDWSFEFYAFAAYIALINILLTFLIVARPHMAKKKRIPVRSKRFIVGVIATLLCTFVFVVGVNIYVIQTNSSSLFKNAQDVPQKQVALLLGAKVYQDGRMSDMLTDRAVTAVELYQNQKVQKILVSGDHGRDNYDEVNTMKKYLLDHDVPAEDIFLDHAGFDTYDSVYRAKTIFEVQSMIIVTQDFHLPRAMYIAKGLGLDAVGLAADKHQYVGESYNEFREIFARVKAFFDVSFHAQPKFGGEVIPITGDSKLSWD